MDLTILKARTALATPVWQESDVDIRSAHPYWAFPYNDVSVVHNGQITNYWIMRRQMERKVIGLCQTVTANYSPFIQRITLQMA